MRVLKFGGTSLANAKRFLYVADILESKVKYDQVAIVLSAPEKITNHLIEMVEKTVNGKNAIININSTKRIFTELLEGIAQVQHNFPLVQLKTLIEQELMQVVRILHNISLLGRCPNSINDLIICQGERFSITIMNCLLKARGYNVTIINPVKKLLAVGHYLESVINITESMRRIIASKIPSDHIILMAGFIAGNEKGELVVLGRNSSDYSATALAACLQANMCEIWTDVDGIYTCDPSQMSNAKLIKSMSYQEAIEISSFGAKILHPRTIPPIAQFQIPCIIKNISNPRASGTLISD